MLPCHGRDRRFESGQVRFSWWFKRKNFNRSFAFSFSEKENLNKAWIAQSVEQWTENPCVGGSIPSPGKTKKRRQLFGVAFCLAGATATPRRGHVRGHVRLFN